MDAENSLNYFSDTESPFKTKKILSLLTNYTWLLFFVLLVTWPKQGLYFYVREQDLPLTYLFIFEIGFVLNGYMNLQCGCGELYSRIMVIRSDYETLNKDSESYSFHYAGTLWSLLHIGFLLLPLLPLLLVAALLSGINIDTFFISILVILQFSVVFRLTGTVMFFMFGRAKKLSYLFSRFMFILIIGLSWFISPAINPILIFINFHFGKSFENIGPFNYFYFLNFYLVILMTLLSFISFYYIHSHIKREKSN